MKAGLLLCAGGGSRFKGAVHKLLHPVAGTPLVAIALEAVRAAEFDLVVVVEGAVDLRKLVKPGEILVKNDRWGEGLATSLWAGISYIAGTTADTVVVGLGDQPGITSQCWRAVGDSSGRPIAVATYHGERRNPVRLDRAIWDKLPKSGDEGARAAMRSHPELVEEVECLGDPGDVDTMEDLIKWNSW